MALLAGCSDDFTQSGGESDFKVSARTSYLRTKTNALSFGADGGAGNTRTIRVETYGTPWVIEPQADWVKVSPENGTGTQDVTVTVEPNPSADVSKHTFLTLKPASSTAMPGVAAASWKVNVDQESPAAFLDAAIEQKSPGIAKKLEVRQAVRCVSTSMQIVSGKLYPCLNGLHMKLMPTVLSLTPSVRIFIPNPVPGLLSFPTIFILASPLQKR